MKIKTRIHPLSLLVLSLLTGGAWAPGVSAQTSDPGAPGPLPVTREEYNFGDTAFQPSDFPGPVELRASIHYPTNLPGGPYPVILLLHGRHATCFNGSGAQFLEWPCAAGHQP